MAIAIDATGGKGIEKAKIKALPVQGGNLQRVLYGGALILALNE